jgi:hypothetical protein
VATAEHLVVVGNQLYYDATVKGQRYAQRYLYRYDLTTKQNAGLVPIGYSTFTADRYGLFFGDNTIPNRDAIVGGPLGGGAFTPGWRSPTDGTPTALALDATYVYWVDSYDDGSTNWFRAARGSFVIPPPPARTDWPTFFGATGPGVAVDHMLVDNGSVFVGFSGSLLKLDIGIDIENTQQVLLLETGGPSGKFAVDDTNFYWIDATNTKLMRFSKSAAPGASATLVASLPADSDNALGSIGGKGIYVLSQPKAGGATGKVLRIDAETGASADIATKLGQPREAVFAQGALYFVASQGIVRIVE